MIRSTLAALALVAFAGAAAACPAHVSEAEQMTPIKTAQISTPDQTTPTTTETKQN